MTWTFDDDPANEQLIELSFSESDGATTVLMVNSGDRDRRAPGDQDHGWRGVPGPARAGTRRLMRGPEDAMQTQSQR